MKKLLALSAIPLVLSLCGAITPGSPEDDAAGRKMLDAMKNIRRTMVLPRTHFIIRSQTKYSGRLYMPDHYKFDDRPLFANRRLWEVAGSDHKAPSFDKTFELYKLSGLDGYATFAWPGVGEYKRTMQPVYTAANKAKLSVMLEVGPQKNYMEIVPETLKLITEDPQSFRVNGKSIIGSYVIDNLSPEQLQRYLDRMQKISGKEVGILPQIHFLRFTYANKRCNGHDLYNIYRRHGTLPSSLIEAMKTYLRSYLAVSDGLYLGHSASRPDSTQDAEFNDVLERIFKSVLAEPAYNGKKMLAFQGKAGYTAYYGSQHVSRDGTQTLRNTLESALRHQADLYIGTEWDELNEDTGFQPLVAKPMSSQRILRYYTDRAKKNAFTPFPGDDTTVPNLILSQRRQVIPGEAVKLELLNIPDASRSEPFQARLELTDESGKVLWRSPSQSFDRAEFGEKTFTLASEPFAAARALRTRIITNYGGKEKVFYTGLPFTIVRGTASADQQYFCTPLRNVLPLERSEIRLAGNKLTCNVRSPEKIAALEVLQNSLEQFAYDPKDEFKCNDDGRVFFHVSNLFYNCKTPPRITILANINVEGAPGTLYFLPGNSPAELYRVSKTVPVYRGFSDWWSKDTFFSVPRAELGKATLVITGERLNGAGQGEKFAWNVPLADVKDVTGKVFSDGLAWIVERDGRPNIRPLPFDSKEAKFSRTMNFDMADAVASVRIVSEDGKVFHSSPLPLPLTCSGKKRTVQVYSDTAKKYVPVTLPAERVPTHAYVFDPTSHVLKSPEGREYYGMIGSYQSAATGFQGLEGAYVPFRSFTSGLFKGADKPAPEWSKGEDGKNVLSFDGTRGNFIMLPNTVIPQRAAYTIEFDIRPDDVKKNQMLLCHQATTFGGLDIGLINGKLALFYTHRNLHDWKLPWYNQNRFLSQVPLENGRFQRVKVAYDGTKFTVSANGKSQSFPCTGTGIYLQSAHFGGRGDRAKDGSIPFFKGLLRELKIKHYVD